MAEQKHNYFGEFPSDAACLSYARQNQISISRIGSIVYLNSTNWNLRVNKNGTWSDLTNPLGTDKVSVDSAATPDYIGAASNDGVLRVNATMTYTDGGDFVTLGADETALNHDALIGVANSVAHTKFLLLDGTRPMTGNLDLDGNKLILDSDGDTTIHSNTFDDIIEFDLGGTTYYQFSIAVLEIFEGNPIYLYNEAGTEYAQIYRNDDYLYIIPDAGGALGLCEAGNVVLYITSSGVEHQAGYPLDMNAQEIILDGDGDTSITADTDDQIDFRIAGKDLVIFKDNDYTFRADASDWYIYMDTYSANTAQTGRFTFRKSHDNTLGTKTETIDADFIGQIKWQGVNTTPNFNWGASIYVFQNGASGTRVPTDMYFATSTSTVALNEWFIIRHDGDIEVRIGTSIEWYNIGNSEHGEIYRDNDYLYMDGGTGGGVKIQVAGGTEITVDVNNVRIPYLMILTGDDETLDGFLTDVTPNGVLEAIAISDETGLNIQWSAGEAFVDGEVIETDARGGDYALDDDDTNYVYVTSAGGSTVQVANILPGGEYALVATIWTYDGDIEYILEEPITAESIEAIHQHLDSVHPALVVSGILVEIDVDGTNANDFTISAGGYYLHAHDLITVAATLYSAGVGHAANDITRYFHTAGNWGTEASNGVDFANWDDGNNKVGTNSGKWYTGWIFLEGDSEIEYVYPQTEHSTEAAAVSEAITYPPLHEGAVIPLAAFVFRHGEAAFSGRAFFIDIRPIHGSGNVAVSVAIQNLWSTFTSDAGSTTADTTLDTLTVTGGNGIATSIGGDTLTIDVSGDVLMFGGAKTEYFNAGNTESGEIYRDNDYLYMDSGTGGNLQFKVAGTYIFGANASNLISPDGKGFRKEGALDTHITLETIDEEITISIGNTTGDSVADLLPENSIIMLVEGIVTQADSDVQPGWYEVGTVGNSNWFRDQAGGAPTLDDEFVNSRNGDGTNDGPFYNVPGTSIRCEVNIAPTGTDVKIHVIVYYWAITPPVPS